MLLLRPATKPARKESSSWPWCGKCEPDCPNTAIAPGDSVYVIDQELCTECVGHADEPTCAQLCPVPDTILIDPARTESRETLQARFEQLHPSA